MSVDRYTFAEYAIGVLQGFLLLALLVLVVVLVRRGWRNRARIGAAIVDGYDHLMGHMAGDESDRSVGRW